MGDDLIFNVIDFGSGLMKVQVSDSGESAPIRVPAVVAVPYASPVYIAPVKDFYCGNEAFQRVTYYEVQHYKVHEMDFQRFDLQTFYRLLDNVFAEALTNAEEGCLIFIKPHGIRNIVVEKIVQNLFEQFCVPGLLIYHASLCCRQAVLPNQCCAVFDGGHSFTSICYVDDNGSILHEETVPFGTRSLEDLLMIHLQKNKDIPIQDARQLCRLMLKSNCSKDEYEVQKGRVYRKSDLVSQALDLVDICFNPTTLIGFKERQIEWKVARLLFIGRTDKESTFFNFPKDVIHQIISKLLKRFMGFGDLIQDVLLRQKSKDFKVIITGGGTLIEGVCERLKRQFGER